MPAQVDSLALSRLHSPTRPAISQDVSVNDTFVSRENYDKLITSWLTSCFGHEKVSILGDEMLSLARAVGYPQDEELPKLLATLCYHDARCVNT